MAHLFLSVYSALSLLLLREHVLSPMVALSGPIPTPVAWYSGWILVCYTTKKDTSVTFWAERIFFCHTYDTSMTIIVTKPNIIIDVVGSYFYDKKS